MDFGILGRLDVRDGDTVVAVRGRQQPKVLAMLLVEDGRVVPVEHLVDALWDDDPPATARRQVQNTVAALRRTLSVAGEVALEQVGAGYRLSAGDLDAARFAELVRLARAEVDGKLFTSAHARLCQALELWRGPALE
ncbi:MAG: AfsR/SARP family transcriptional regulator, partial [Stackebrandtia sp.]